MTPIFNQSLNRTPNELDTVSIDSFDTLPDPLPIDHQIRPAPNFLSSNPPHSPSSLLPPPPPLQSHPSFFLLNGFTAEFKINNSDRKGTSDKQVQVDIRYLPMTGDAENCWTGCPERTETKPNEQLNGKLNALRYPNGAADASGTRAAGLANDKAFFSENGSVTKRPNRFQSDHSKVPTFYVLDDLFGEIDFKQRRSLIRGKPRSEPFRPGKSDFFFGTANLLQPVWSTILALRVLYVPP